MRKIYTVIIATAVLAGGMVLGGSTPAEAELAMQSSTDIVEVKLYGQVDRAVMYGDNGNQDAWFQVDNDNSSTRLGLKGKAKVSDTFSTGITFEGEWQYNPSNSVTFEDQTKDDQFTLRKFELFFDSKTYGRIAMGQGNTASNETSEVDLSGTSVAGYSDLHTWGGSLVFYDKDTESDGPNIKSVFNNMDGLSRQDRLRYDSPSFSGFMLSGSWVEDSQWDLALRYKNKFDGWQLAGAIAYADFGDAKDQTQFNGSISVLLDMGLNLTLAAGEIDPDNSSDKPKNYYAKIGYLTKALTEAGKTGISLDFGQCKDLQEEGDKAKEFGIQLVQKVDSWGTEFFGAYRLFKLDRAAADYDNLYIVAAGARIKF